MKVASRKDLKVGDPVLERKTYSRVNSQERTPSSRPPHAAFSSFELETEMEPVQWPQYFIRPGGKAPLWLISPFTADLILGCDNV